MNIGAIKVNNFTNLWLVVFEDMDLLDCSTYIMIKLLQTELQSLLSVIKGGYLMIEYIYDTQLLIEGQNLSEDEINEYITVNIEGDCLLAVGDEELIKIHFHTNTPWKVLEYCASLGEIYDVVIENMKRQADGLNG
jgi:hypothetical protein